MEEQQIIEYLANRLEPEEQDRVKQWIDASPSNRDKFYELKNLWALTGFLSGSVAAEKRDLIKFIRKLKESRTHKLKATLMVLTRYAAILILAFAAGFLIKEQFGENGDQIQLAFNEISVPPGQMAQVILSDGTEVTVNSSSKLRYPALFVGAERRVVLSGEAYFSVVKGDKPFRVETENREVEALGTSFNIMAYGGDDVFQATLVEGSVRVADRTGHSLALLKPGEQYSYHSSSGEQWLREVNTELFYSWKDGVYIFDRETLGDLVRRLERIFDVKIDITDVRIANYKFTGTISRRVPFEQILKIIQISAPVKYKIVRESDNAITEVQLY